jgi:hypothetical protein
MKRGHGWLKLAIGVAVGFIGGLLTTLMPSVEAAPEPTPVGLELAGETVHLGSAKVQLITRLSKGLVLENSGKLVDGAEFWFVKDKGAPQKTVGSLQFKNDSLVTATRDWDEIDPDTKTAAFLKALYGAVEHVFGKGQPGLVKCTLKREPGKEHFQIDLSSPRHIVTLALFDAGTPSGRPYSLVEESIVK